MFRFNKVVRDCIAIRGAMTFMSKADERYQSTDKSCNKKLFHGPFIWDVNIDNYTNPLDKLRHGAG